MTFLGLMLWLFSMERMTIGKSYYIYMINILVVDSGVGAVSVAKEIGETLQANIFVYIDNKHAPLGEKNSEELIAIADEMLTFCLKKIKIDLVVLACNTLTVGTIKYLREKFKLPIVGTEPNIKIAESPAIVLCTTFTFNNCKIINCAKLDKKALPNLATLIDKNFCDLAKIDKEIMQLARSLVKYNAISLGCTHYTFITAQLKKYLPKVKIYENKFGVAKRVKQIIENDKTLLLKKGKHKKTKYHINLVKKDTKLFHSIKKFLNKVEYNKE